MSRSVPARSSPKGPVPSYFLVSYLWTEWGVWPAEGPPGGILQGCPCVIYCALGALVPPLGSHVDLEASSYSLTRLHWRESVTGGHTSGSAATLGARPTASSPRATCSGRRQDPEEAGPHRLLGFPESHSSGYKMTSGLHGDLPA